MKRLVPILALALASLALPAAAEERLGGDMKARQLWFAADKLFREGKNEEAEKASLELLALNPSTPIVLRASIQLTEIYLDLKKLDKAQECLARAEEALKAGGKPAMQAKALYLRAALACLKGDAPGSVEQLRKAVAASEEAVLWASGNKVSHFPDLVVLDETSPLAREFDQLSNPENYDKELRAQMKAACQEAKKQGKLVLLDFYGGW